MSLLIHLRRKTKKAEKRELAESLEDARIFASSRHIMDGGFPHPQQTMPLYSRNGVNTPNDQVRYHYLYLTRYNKIDINLCSYDALELKL